MRKAFVFGKFMPFHKGHEAMINFALTQCDFLSVLVCCSDKETMPAAWRVQWIKQTYLHDPRVEVLPYLYEEASLPSTSVASETVSFVWAKEFRRLFPDHSIVVTAEPYGDMVAGFMGITHIPFSKRQHTVSATDLRQDLFEHWNYLPDSVKATLVTKVVVLGTESTGKTTMATRLAAYFDGQMIAEAGRDLIPNSNHFTIDDLYTVAAAHAANINRAATGPKPLLLIDTDVHITTSYGEFALGESLTVSDSVYNSNKADLYLYLNNDVMHIQDGTRLHETERDRLDFSHRRTLERFGIQYEEIGGSNWDARFETAVKLVKELIRKKTVTWYL
jgi:HTH-type transcriptional regulator, transcriptional repressor of NAD biosynthesis genes